MTANFYNISCPKNTLDKGTYLAANPTNVTISPYEALDDTHGYIIVSSAQDEYNYVKIKALNGRDRYYFITARDVETAQRCKLTLEEDVLMTFLPDIKEMYVLPKRAYHSSIMNADLPDKRPTYQYSVTTQYASYTADNCDFHYGDPTVSAAQDENIILVVSGKGVI